MSQNTQNEILHGKTAKGDSQKQYTKIIIPPRSSDCHAFTMFMRSFSLSNLYLIVQRRLAMKSLIPAIPKLKGTGSSVKYLLLYQFFFNDATHSKASKQAGTDGNTDSTDIVLHLSACKAESCKLHFLWKLS